MEFLDEFYQLLGYVHIRKLVQVANPSNGDLAGAFLGSHPSSISCKLAVTFTVY